MAYDTKGKTIITPCGAGVGIASAGLVCMRPDAAIHDRLAGYDKPAAGSSGRRAFALLGSVHVYKPHNDKRFIYEEGFGRFAYVIAKKLVNTF